MEGALIFVTAGRSRAPARSEPPDGARATGPGGAKALRSRLRRRFTAAYKLRILRLADQAVEKGQGALAALLAREGLYSSHLAQWRKRKLENSLENTRRGRAPMSRLALLRENRSLKRKLAELEAGLRETARLAAQIQERSTGAFGHAGGFLRRRLLDLAESAR